MTDDSAKFLSHQNAAALNRNAILNYIKNNAPISRTDIWEKMGLSRASVTQIIKQLIDKGFVFETGTGESRGGRKPSFLEFSANARNVLAFDWHLKTLFLINLNSDIVFSKSLALTNTMNANNFVFILSQSIQEIIKAQRLDHEKILGLGLIMPGLIDSTKGIIMLSIEQNWKDISLVEMLEKATGINTILEADGNMQALGEFINRAERDVKDFVLFEIEEDGVGTAQIFNGELQRGSNNMSGEIGHIILNSAGPQCSCGKKGCIEAFIKSAIRKKSNNWKDEASVYIGQAISIIINLLDPKVIVLSGNVVDKGGDDFLLKIRSLAMENVINAEKRDIKIEKSITGRYAGVKGICSLIYDSNFKEL